MNKLSTVFPIMIDKYEQFIPNIEGMGVPDKINAIIQYLNRIGKLSNDVVADWNKVMVWVMDEGLTDSVNAKIDDLIAKGLFDELLQTSFDDINTQLVDIAYNVKSFGVKGDGVTDDSNAFQSAFDYIATNYNTSDINANIGLKSSLIIPAGKYVLGKTVYIKSPVLIKGSGANGTVSIQGSWTGTNYFDLFTLVDTTQSARINFENVRFSEIPPTKAAIFGQQFTVDGYIKNCWFEAFGSTNSSGIRGSFANYLIEGNVFEHLNPAIEINTHDGQNRIINNDFYRCYKGVKLQGLASPNDWQTKDTIIAHNHFVDCPNDSSGGYFVLAELYHMLVIEGNITNNGTSALVDNLIYLTSCKDVIVTNNVLDGVVLKGIYLANSTKCNINNNVIRTNINTNAVIAINLDGGSDHVINGNNISNFGNITNSQGILINNSNNNIVNDNQVSDVYFGLRTTGTSVKNSFSNNKVASSNKRYDVYSDVNYVKVNKFGFLSKGNGDYTFNGSEPYTILFDITAFTTINFSVLGEYTGEEYTVINAGSSTQSLQIYDGVSASSRGSITAGKSCKVLWNGTAWIISAFGTLTLS
jgi:parallel beta-helix repeat protein